MEIVIRRPFSREREEIHSLFEETIVLTLQKEGAGDEHELIGDLVADQKELIDLDFETSGKEVYFLVAETDGRVAGTICHRLCSDIIEECSHGRAKGMHEIGSVYILPQFQGKGLCRLLLNSMYVTLLAKGFEEFWLDSGYAVARQVWEKILGQPTIIMKNYWAPGAHHHIWHRRLDEVQIKHSI